MSVSRAKHRELASGSWQWSAGQGALPPSFGHPRSIFGKVKGQAARLGRCFARETLSAHHRTVGQGIGNPRAALCAEKRG